MFSHTEPWHSFVISIWLSRTGAAGVKFVVSDSSLPSPPSKLTVALADEKKKARCSTFVSSVASVCSLNFCGIRSLSKWVHSHGSFCLPRPLFAWNTSLYPINKTCPITSVNSNDCLVKYALHRNNKPLAGENHRFGHYVLPLCMHGWDTLCSSSIRMKDVRQPPKGHFTSHALNICSAFQSSAHPALPSPQHLML